MTVQELIEKLTRLGRPDAQVTTEYHLHNYLRTVQATPVRHALPTSVFVDADGTMFLPREDESTEDGNLKCAEVVVIS